MRSSSSWRPIIIVDVQTHPDHSRVLPLPLDKCVLPELLLQKESEGLLAILIALALEHMKEVLCTDRRGSVHCDAALKDLVHTRMVIAVDVRHRLAKVAFECRQAVADYTVKGTPLH